MVSTEGGTRASTIKFPACSAETLEVNNAIVTKIEMPSVNMKNIIIVIISNTFTSKTRSSMFAIDSKYTNINNRIALLLHKLLDEKVKWSLEFKSSYGILPSRRLFSKSGTIINFSSFL